MSFCWDRSFVTCKGCDIRLFGNGRCARFQKLRHLGHVFLLGQDWCRLHDVVYKCDTYLAGSLIVHCMCNAGLGDPGGSVAYFLPANNG